MTRRPKNLNHSGFVITGEGATVMASAPAAGFVVLSVAAAVVVGVALTAMLLMDAKAVHGDRAAPVKPLAVQARPAPRISFAPRLPARQTATPRRALRRKRHRRGARWHRQPAEPPRRFLRPAITKPPTPPAASTSPRPTPAPPSPPAGPGEFF